MFGKIAYNVVTPVLLAIALDIITGLIFAFIKGEFKSSVMRQGALHKASELLMIAGCGLFDYAQIVYGWSNPVNTVKYVCAYLFVMEIMSIFENVRKAGLRLPGFITKILADKESEYGMKEDDR